MFYFSYGMGAEGWVGKVVTAVVKQILELIVVAPFYLPLGLLSPGPSDDIIIGGFPPHYTEQAQNALISFLGLAFFCLLAACCMSSGIRGCWDKDFVPSDEYDEKIMKMGGWALKFVAFGIFVCWCWLIDCAVHVKFDALKTEE